MPTSWLDLNYDGKRMESLIREMRSKAKKASLDDNHDLFFAYVDRMIKAQNTKLNLAEIVLNVKGFLALAQKQYGKLPTNGVLVPAT
jgi:hypothetical protein